MDIKKLMSQLCTVSTTNRAIGTLQNREGVNCMVQIILSIESFRTIKMRIAKNK